MKQTWRCPQCGATTTTYVRLTTAPVCANPTKHRHTPLTMEQKKKADPLNRPD